MSITAIMNQKGGVGKTTTCINLAAQAALSGRTLMVDADKQSSLSRNFGETDPKTSIYDAFMGRPFEVVNVRKNLDLLPATIDFAGVDLEIQNEFSREMILSKAISKIKGNYEYIFIDCPPDISLVTINALACSDFVILPIKASRFSIDGITIMLDFITKIKNGLNPDISILGLLLTHYDERLKISKHIEKEIKENGWDVALFDTRIRNNTAIENSQFEKKTIFEFDKRCHGTMDYMSLGKEVKRKIRKHNSL